MQKSDISEGNGEMRFFNIDETDDKIMRKSVWISDIKECTEKWKVNLKYRICVDSAHDIQNEMGNVNIFIDFKTKLLVELMGNELIIHIFL